MKYLDTHSDRIKIQEDNANQFFNLLKKLGFLKGARTVFDVGSGRGFLVQICREDGMDCYGCDVDEDAFYDKKVLKLDICTKNLPFADNFFDIVAMHEVLDHLKEPFKTMEEITRVTKEGGKLMIASDSISTYKKLLNFYGDSTHIRPYTKEAIQEILAMHGFKTILCEPKLAGKTFLWKLPGFIKWWYGNSILIIGEKQTKKTQ